MNLIENYLSEVGRNLPSKGQADIQAEIRSILEDMLEERGKAAGHPVDDELTLEVLKEFGSPRKVAASYAPQRYLIGPRLYPVFERVLYAFLPITVVLALIGLGVSLGNTHVNANHFFGLVLSTFGSMLWSFITTAGVLVFIFAIIERSAPEFKVPEKEWDPRTLAKLSPPDRLRYGDTIVETVSCFASILLLNFYPQILSFMPSGSPALPLFSQAFFRWLPALDVMWGLTIALDLILLTQGRWLRWNRWASVGLKALSIGLAIAMLVGPSLIALTAASLTSAGLLNAETAESLVKLLEQIVRITLAVSILIGAWEIIRILVRLLGRGGRQVVPVEK
jgi:hypothetical protein